MSDEIVLGLVPDRHGELEVSLAPEYKLLQTFLSSDLSGVEHGAYPVVRSAVESGLADGAAQEVVSDGFIVNVAGSVTTLRLLTNEDRMVVLTTEQMLEALDAYAQAMQHGDQ